MNILLASHFKLYSGLFPSSVEEKDYMSRVPYANVARCLVYAMVCTSPDISCTFDVFSKYMENMEKRTLECSEMCSSVSKRHK